MISPKPIDFNEISKDFNQSNLSLDTQNLIEAGRQLVEKQGLKGFFGSNKASPAPLGIVLDYDVEEVKDQIVPKV